MIPNIIDIKQHLTILYYWAIDIDSLFEIRCIQPEKPILSRLFRPYEIDKAVSFVDTNNRLGYNCYSIPTILKPNTVGNANDNDVLYARYHYIDADDNDIAQLRSKLAATGFHPTFEVITGTVPKERLQIAFRLNEPMSDLDKWRKLQHNISSYFHTDTTIKNPSRLMRLAGTISYPPTRKIERGYITELTTLTQMSEKFEVDNHDFYNAFQEHEQTQCDDDIDEPEVDPQFKEAVKFNNTADVPSYVMHAAFLPIPPTDDYDIWLEFGYAAKEANPYEGFAAWTEWSKNSRKYDGKHQRETWEALQPHIITRQKLFAAAKKHKPFWWRDHGRVEKWWQEFSKSLNDHKTATVGSFPSKFEMTERGLYYIQPPKKPGDESERFWICNPFKVIGRTSNIAGAACGILIRFRNDDVQHEVIVTAEELHKAASILCSNLADKGLRIETKQFCRELLQEALNKVTVTRKFLSVRQTGWYQPQDNKWVYILPDRKVVGDNENCDVVLQAEPMPGCKTAGSLDDWQCNIGAYLPGNSRLSFFTCAAFAAPLLDISNEGAAGFHLHGESKNGKTTALVVASSVWGKGDSRGGYTKTWEATSTGLETIAAQSSDCLLPLDELSQAPAQQVSGIIYKLINGTGRVRGKAQGGIREIETWRTLLLSTGEETPEQRINETGNHSNAGINVRVIVIPADAGAGPQMGVVEDLHGLPNSAEYVRHLSNAATTYYGTPVREFIKKLVELRNADDLGLRDEIKDFAIKFKEQYVPPDANGQVISVANKFALIAFAGNLAQVFDIFPANLTPEKDAAICFKAWLDERGDVCASEHITVIRTVRQFIQAHGESRFQRVPRGEFNQNISNRVGFRYTDSDDPKSMGPYTWYILCDQMGEIVKTMSERVVAKILNKAGCIEQGSQVGLRRICKFFEQRHKVYKLNSRIFDAD